MAILYHEVVQKKMTRVFHFFFLASIHKMRLQLKLEQQLDALFRAASSRQTPGWSNAQRNQLFSSVTEHGTDWAKVSKHVPEKTAEECRTYYEAHIFISEMEKLRANSQNSQWLDQWLELSDFMDYAKTERRKFENERELRARANGLYYGDDRGSVGDGGSSGDDDGGSVGDGGGSVGDGGGGEGEGSDGEIAEKKASYIDSALELLVDAAEILSPEDHPDIEFSELALKLNDSYVHDIEIEDIHKDENNYRTKFQELHRHYRDLQSEIQQFHRDVNAMEPSDLDPKQIEKLCKDSIERFENKIQEMRDCRKILTNRLETFKKLERPVVISGQPVDSGGSTSARSLSGPRWRELADRYGVESR